MAKVTHTHIDSSGCFLCPLGSACDKPNAGEQFDAMQEALEQIANGIVMNPDSSYSHADTVLAYQKLARIAIAKTKGKAKVKG